MDKNIFPLIFLSIIWTLEYFLPFFADSTNRFKHGLKNLSIGLINYGILSFVFSAIVFSVIAKKGGLLNSIDVHPILETLIAFVLFDLYMYFWHLVNHKISFLWRFHKFHHEDIFMDSTTAVRFHTAEIVLSSCIRLAAIYLIGMSLNHILLYEAILFPVIIFHHSNINIPIWLDKILSVVIASPNTHKVHHSNIKSETDSNYGSVLSVWDRLFNTIKTKKSYHEIRFGISK